jgi:RNA polymerase sigma factor (TIGR02999 family)
MLKADHPSSLSQEITALLQASRAGDQNALDTLIPLVYEQLHLLAKRYMANEQPDATLQATALVSELYLRLVDTRRIVWNDRNHFFAVCAQLMRRVLVDAARGRNSLKRGGHLLQVALDEQAVGSAESPADLLALDVALDHLAAFDRRKSQVVEMRFFGGLDVKETAAALNVSEETVLRDWRVAKVWLHRELSRERPNGPGPVAADISR